MQFLSVTDNLRDSFRILSAGRPRAHTGELPGIGLASLGVAFQMFNAAFLSAPVDSPADMEMRLQTARRHFEALGIPWSFWICEDWLTRKVRRKLSQICFDKGLRLAAEMPGMIAQQVEPPSLRHHSELVIRRVDSIHSLAHFRAIGSTCFHVPIIWFTEVFDDNLSAREDFVCWVGYHDGVPVATAASVTSAAAIGIYNVGTMPGHRGRGNGEAITRHAIAQALCSRPGVPVVLQSTEQGLKIYERMGFRAITRILVYNSAPQ